MVAGGVKPLESFMKKEENLIPKGVDWFKLKASSFDPDNNTVTLQDGKKIKYDYLVIATGMLVDFDGVSRVLNRSVSYGKKVLYSLLLFFVI